jgi:GNAT superfamily N-acetyltransferase
MLDQIAFSRIANDSQELGPAHECWEQNISRLHPGNLFAFRSHLMRLDENCRRARFGGAVPDRFLLDYVARLDLANTRVLGCFVNGYMRGAAELRSLQSQWSREAELALSVETAWQVRGVGTALLAEVVRNARDLCIDHIYMSWHIFNAGIQGAAKSLANKVRFEDCECFADIGVRWLPVAAELETGSHPEQTKGAILALDL